MNDAIPGWLPTRAATCIMSFLSRSCHGPALAMMIRKPYPPLSSHCLTRRVSRPGIRTTRGALCARSSDALLEGHRIHGGADAPRDPQWRSDELKLVDPIARAVVSQGVEVPDLAQHEAHIP